MIDGCGRTIDHLRLSLTDHCNLACRYCVPAAGVPGETMIDPDFAFALVHWLATRHGVRHVRLTGGEPLLYPHLLPLIERLARLDDLDQVTLTTNAQALSHLAQRLGDAGLSRINVSLDTLRPDRFSSLTRGGVLGHTLAGIEAAVEADLTPVKINVVAQRGLNDDELHEIAAWGVSHGCVVRFLEVMPIGPLAHLTDRHLVPASLILERLSERFALRALPRRPGDPALDYAVGGGDRRGVVGIIAPTTQPFCAQCRRLRITARGMLVPCVHDSNRIDLTPFWDRRRLDGPGADAVLAAAVRGKAAVGPRGQSLTMLSLGG